MNGVHEGGERMNDSQDNFKNLKGGVMVFQIVPLNSMRMPLTATSSAPKNYSAMNSSLRDDATRLHTAAK